MRDSCSVCSIASVQHGEQHRAGHHATVENRTQVEQQGRPHARAVGPAQGRMAAAQFPQQPDRVKSQRRQCAAADDGRLPGPPHFRPAERAWPLPIDRPVLVEARPPLAVCGPMGASRGEVRLPQQEENEKTRARPASAKGRAKIGPARSETGRTPPGRMPRSRLCPDSPHGRDLGRGRRRFRRASAIVLQRPQCQQASHIPPIRSSHAGQSRAEDRPRAWPARRPGPRGHLRRRGGGRKSSPRPRRYCNARFQESKAALPSATGIPRRPRRPPQLGVGNVQAGSNLHQRIGGKRRSRERLRACRHDSHLRAAAGRGGSITSNRATPCRHSTRAATLPGSAHASRLIPHARMPRTTVLCRQGRRSQDKTGLRRSSVLFHAVAWNGRSTAVPCSRLQSTKELFHEIRCDSHGGLAGPVAFTPLSRQSACTLPAAAAAAVSEAASELALVLAVRGITAAATTTATTMAPTPAVRGAKPDHRESGPGRQWAAGQDRQSGRQQDHFELHARRPSVHDCSRDRAKT